MSRTGAAEPRDQPGVPLVIARGYALAGRRLTRQRREVAAALDSLKEFASARQVHEVLAGRGVELGLSTVYRSLRSLAAVGVLDAVRGPAGETRYRSCQVPHRHHLVCRECGYAAEYSAALVEAWAARVGACYGYAGVVLVVEMSGICKACRRRLAPS